LRDRQFLSPEPFDTLRTGYGPQGPESKDGASTSLTAFATLRERIEDKPP